MSSKLNIRFVIFHRSEALEVYTTKHIRNLLLRIDRRSGETKSIEVQFKLDAKAPLGTLKNSEVMISYRYPGVKKILHVKRQGIDLRRVIMEAIKTTEVLIQRATEKSEGGRRTLGKSKRRVRDIRQEQAL
jgi:hypothetical protein